MWCQVVTSKMKKMSFISLTTNAGKGGGNGNTKGQDESNDQKDSQGSHKDYPE
jgi:hypothetical protein